MKPKAIIFDFDDTLYHLSVDWGSLIIELQEEFRAQGYTDKFTQLYPSLQKGYQYIKEHQSEKVAISFKQRVNEIMYIYEKNGYEKGKIFPNTLTTLQLLSEKRVPFAILSSNSQKVLRTFQEEHGLHMQLVGREDVLHMKPHPEGVHALLQHWKMIADEVWGVGNSVDDYGAFQQANLKKIFLVENNLGFSINDKTKIISHIGDIQDEF